MIADEDLHRHAVENLDQADALLFGRVRESGKGLFVGGVKLPLALAELGLIDEYEFVVQPRLAGHGPTLFAGLSKRIDLKLVSGLEFGSGAVAMRYELRR
jgi:dihydrofolate reductase